MQRLNLLALAAFLLGVCAFAIDSATPASTHLSSWESASMEAADGSAAALQN